MAKGRIEVDQVFDPKLLLTAKELSEALNTLAADIKQITVAGKQQAQTIDEMNKAEQKQLEIETNINNSRDRAIKKQQEYTIELAKVKDAEQKRRRELDWQAKEQNAVAGSVNKMTAALERLKMQYRAGGVELQNKLRPQIQAMDKEVKRLNASIGDHQKNVGNYKSALQGLGGELQAQTGRLGQFAAMFAKAGPIGLAVGGLAAAISAPFVAFFTLTEKGSEMLERKMAGWKAAAKVIGGEFAKLGEEIVGEDTGGSKIGGILGKIGIGFTYLAGFLTNGTFNIGLSKLRNYFGELGERMDEASTKAQAFTRTMQELEEQEYDVKIQRSATNRQLAEAKLLYEQEGISLEEKRDRLKTVLDLEAEMSEAETEFLLKKKAALVVQFMQLTADHNTNEAEKIGFEIKTLTADINDRITESLIRRRKATITLGKAEKDVQDQYKLLAFPKAGSEADISGDVAAMENSMFPAPEKVQSDADQVKDIMENLADSQIENSDAVISKLDEEREKRLQIAEEVAQTIEGAGQLGDAIFDRKIQQIEESGASEQEKEKKIAQLKRKQAIWDKAQALIQVGINTAISASQALAKPFLLTFVLIQGAIQAAIIAAKKIPDIPQFFKGVFSSPGGASWVGEQGRELITLPSGDQLLTPEHATLLNLPAHSEVMPNDVLRAELAGMPNSRGYAHVKTDLQREMLSALIQIRDNEQYDLGDYVVIRKGNSERRIRKNR